MSSLKKMIIESALIESSRKLVFSLKDLSHKKLKLEVYKEDEKYTFWLTDERKNSFSWSSIYHNGPTRGHEAISKEVRTKIEGFAKNKDKKGLVDYLKSISGNDWK